MAAALLALLLPAHTGKPVTLYVELQENLIVILTTGAKWQMEKGDCFPIVAYKESHTKVILQLAGAQFMVDSEKTKLVAEKDTPAAVERYRANVSAYINGYSDRWIRDAKEPEQK